MEESSADPDAAGEIVSAVRPEEMAGQLGWRAWRKEPSKRPHQRLETQWQDFLRQLNSPQTSRGKEPGPWDDTKAFLASFEHVAEACQWPRDEWVARLLPALSGEAQEAFESLETKDREDYGKVKAAILRREAKNTEALRQHFRQFRSREVEDPRGIYSQLQELCCRWLRPEKNSKEQILELLILEQFLSILPPELQSWIRASSPENGTEAAALAEDFLRSQKGAEAEKWQGPLKEECVDVEAHALQRPICKETEPGNEEAMGLLGKESEGSHLSHSSCPPEEQETDRTRPTETDFKMADVSSLRLAEQTPVQAGQRNTFWQVLQEDGGNINSLGDGRRRWIKKEHDIPVETGPEETVGTLGGDAPWRTPEIYPERCESKGLRQEVEPVTEENEGKEHSGGLTHATGEIPAEDAVEKKALFSKYRRKYRHKPGALRGRAREGVGGGPTIGVDTQRKDSPEPHLRIQADEKRYEPSEGTKADHVTGGQSNPQGERTCECPECRESPGGQKSSKSHRADPVAERPFECSQCGKSYRQRVTLLKHRKIHTGEKPHECPVCGKVFAVKLALTRHQRIHTDEKPFQCPHCEKIFRHQQTLKKHLALHARERRHDCPLCGEDFPSRDTLWRHQSVHAGERPHACPQCAKRFQSKFHLMRHQRIHTGEKPFQCTQCSKAFRQQDHLRVHQRIHTGEKLFECPDCGMHFSHRNKLIGHQETHRGQQLYLCPECGKSFSQKASLTKHRSSHVGY
ncbi:uncharacterized protein LOC143833967 isoform X2 [Paroedura picta]|uniref:uncharacterized protein LOC143833967 isoform X2 n=1 Tax=Paroedura picta TaxID=143630 RepID=UPI004056AD67